MSNGIKIKTAPWQDYLRLGDIWKLGSGEGITIAIIDSCINKNYIDISDAIDLERSKSFIDNSIFSLQDIETHGTDMCRIIASRGIEGYYGIAMKSKIVLYSIALECYNDKNWSTEFILQSMNDIEKQDDIKIINMSFQLPQYITPLMNLDLTNIQKKIDSMIKKGKIFIAAAGNDPANNNIPYPIPYPAKLKNVLAIGAANYSSTILEVQNNFNQGPELFCRCIGDNIKLDPNEAELNIETSTAAAVMSGLIADFLSYRQSDASIYKQLIDEIKKSLVDENRVQTNSVRRDDNIGYGFIEPAKLFL